MDVTSKVEEREMNHFEKKKTVIIHNLNMYKRTIISLMSCE